MSDRLRATWDFDDLDTTETRFREQLKREETDFGRADVLTQLAPVEVLRGDFDAGDRLIDEAEGLAEDDAIARTRIELERGRLRRSGGDPAAARPMFDAAFRLALEGGSTFIAVDAAHMAALAAPDLESFIDWTDRGVEIAEKSGHARYWLGPLYNNLGWAYYDEEAYDAALDAFRRGLEAREENPENRRAIEIARRAVGKALRALGRSDEGVPWLEGAVAWANAEGAPTGWFHEELAGEYAALGRDREAAEQARAGIPLLERDDPAFTSDEDRLARLRALAEGA